MADTKQTCLYEKHVALGGRVVDFAGWDLPVQFEGILAEHNHCRQQVALFDTCHMGQVLITGSDAPAQMSYALTQDCEKLPVGRGKYGFLLNETGGVIDDTIIMRLAETEYLLIVNAATAADDVATLQARTSGDVTIQHLTDWAKLDVQGPLSCETLAPFCEIDLKSLKYFGCCRTKVDGVDCVLSRTGYTGELGYEIFMPADKLPALFDKLLSCPNVKPAGLGARDSLRLEMGYALYGHELSTDISPLEAGMEFFFDINRDFFAADVLRKQAETGVSRKLVVLDSAQRRRFNTGDKIIVGDQEIGEVTSGAFSPSLQRVIGMGYVKPEFAAVGTELAIRTSRADIPATVGKLPLYTEGTCRKKLDA